jgi:phospholipid transport system transporter-binding protein
VGVEISEAAPGRINVSGELTFATARDARQIGTLVLESSTARSFVIDCAGIKRADSAGLAVLLDWLSWGRRKSRSLSFENLPPALVAIAKISEVDGLLTATAYRPRRESPDIQCTSTCGPSVRTSRTPHNAIDTSSSLRISASASSTPACPFAASPYR